MFKTSTQKRELVWQEYHDFHQGEVKSPAPREE